ncbi:hypothetical protein NSTC745_01459 [Nostoc sp. DSM 114161]|jgi:hypothetical protein|uniref:RICIN domain-containing protein n=1 Tax=Nostoc sp. DSM 114161 TaxID=3440143 RepID=UPI0040460936
MATTSLPTQTSTNGTQLTSVYTVAKFASGRTEPGVTNWKKDGDSIGIYIDTSAAGFTKTPIYVTSLGGFNGGSHWATTGATSIYNATEKGFTVYVRFDQGYNVTPITPEDANQRKWHINWFGIEPFLEQGSGSGTQSSSTTTKATPLPAAGKYYKLANKNSGKYLDVSGASTENGANVQQWTSNTTQAQQWLLEDAGNGYYYLVNKSGKALNVAGGGSADGANVIQWSKGNDDNSKWKLEDAGDGYFYLIAKHSGKALDVASAGTADGANVQQYSKNFTNAQKWKFEPV